MAEDKPLDQAMEDEDLEAQLAYENLKRKREAKRRRRIVAAASAAVAAMVALIILVAGQADVAAAEEDAFLQVPTSMVYRGDFATIVSANGATEPLSSTVVTPEVDGIIENLQIAEGSVVNAGDVLFTLRNESLDKAVREATDQVASAERAVNMAQAGINEANAAYERAWNACNQANDWSGFDEVALRGAITSAENTYSDAVATLERMRAALGEAQATADKRTVRAPVSGSVVALNAQDGAGVGGVAGSGVQGGSSGPLVQISDLSQMKVTVQVNEVDIASIQEGQPAVATFSALSGVELAASVRRIASVSTGSAEGAMGGVVTYAVDLLIPNPDPKLKPGMTATVSITTQSAPDSLIVPSSAVWEGAGGEGISQHFVTVLMDEQTGETRDVAVEVIVQNSSEAAVRGELEEGDLVMLGGSVDVGDAGLSDSERMG